MIPSKDRTLVAKSLAVVMGIASIIAAFSLFSPESEAQAPFIHPASANCPPELIIEVLDSAPVSIHKCAITPVNK